MSEASPSCAPIASTGERDDGVVALRLLALVTSVLALLYLTRIVDEMIQSMSFGAWFVVSPPGVSRIDNAIVAGKHIGGWLIDNPVYLPALVEGLAAVVVVVLGAMFAGGAHARLLHWLFFGGRR